MSSTYGEAIKLSIFGQSHGVGIGMTLDGVPAGFPVDFKQLQCFLDRRAPGLKSYATTRREEDHPEFLSGITNGYTCGAPIAAVIYNNNQHSSDYSNLKDCPRPGHADYPAQVKYHGFQDISGGGHFSGRLTAPLCIAGGLCIQWLGQKGIQIGAHLLSVAGIKDTPLNPLNPQIQEIGIDFPVLNSLRGEQMQQAIENTKNDSDSVGGMIECAVTGLPAGLGEPMFGGMESRIASVIYGIPAIKSVEFGEGAHAASLRGSQNNDCYTICDGKIKTATNHAGGILGGITTGMPLLFRVAVKPTPSIGKPQQSISYTEGRCTQLTIKGRHDPCIAPRAVPVVEAAAALAIFDAYLCFNR